MRLLFLFLLIPCLSFGQQIECSEWTPLVPSDALPKEVQPQRSNNNLDIVRYKDRYYFAFRTGPTHFASEKTQLYLLSSADLEKWEYEAEFQLGYDMREPRFVVYQGKLLFYFFEAGKHPLKFEPRHLWVCETTGDGKWSECKDAGLDGYVPWRIREHQGKLYLSAYYGVGLYLAQHEADLRLFESTDGYHWQPISKEAQVTRIGAEEGEFIFDDEGNLWGTIRLENEGGMIVYADKDSLHKWHQRYTPYKYDSALLFKHENEIYLISRRNLDGKMAKAPQWWSLALRQKYNLLRYSATKKRTALFHLNKQSKELEHLMDFPSTGDTAFPGIVALNEQEYLVLNYSNRIDKGSKSWIHGQLTPTYIYQAVLSFTD